MRLTGSRRGSLGPTSRSAGPHLIPTPSGRGQFDGHLVLDEEAQSKHSQFIGIDTAKDSQCTRWPDGLSRSNLFQVYDGSAPCWRGARTIFQVVDKCSSTLPGLETDFLLSEQGQTVLRP